MDKIIAVDFDGCLGQDKWPDIGEPIQETVDALKADQAAGAKVILWTCRAGAQEAAAVAWCEDHGIRLDAVNRNLPESIEAFGGDAVKVFAHEYWDDKARIMPHRGYPDIFIGNRFGSLTVLEFERRQGETQKKWYARCQCDCGNEKWIMWPNLQRGLTKSCGCKSREALQRYFEAVRTKNAEELSKRGERIARFYYDNPHLSLQDAADTFGCKRQYVSYCVNKFYPTNMTTHQKRAERKKRVMQMLGERNGFLAEKERSGE